MTEKAKTISIWVSLDDIADIKRAAKAIDRSVSWYLVGLHRKSVDQGQSKKPANPEKLESHRVDEPTSTIPETKKKRGRSPEKPKAKKRGKWTNPLDGTALAPREGKD